MPRKQRTPQETTFRYRRKKYEILDEIRLRGRLYWIVEKWRNVYKVFDPSIQEMRTIRFRKTGSSVERRLLQNAARDNPNLPRVLDHGRYEEREYLILEWIDGYTLQHYMIKGRKGRPYFIAEKSYKLILGLVKGLRRLHQRSIVHGDLKPSNIIIGQPDRLIMIDFGIAWSGERARQRPKEATAGYAAPEQWQSERLVDHRADQFAVSAMLYQMLAGELPYDGLGGRASEYDNSPSLEPPSRKNPNVWPSLDCVVVRGVSLNKDERYDTTSGWLTALQLATPPGAFGRFVRTQWNQAINLWNRVR